MGWGVFVRHSGGIRYTAVGVPRNELVSFGGSRMVRKTSVPVGDGLDRPVNEMNGKQNGGSKPTPYLFTLHFYLLLPFALPADLCIMLGGELSPKMRHFFKFVRVLSSVFSHFVAIFTNKFVKIK